MTVIIHLHKVKDQFQKLFTQKDARERIFRPMVFNSKISKKLTGPDEN